jgi:hypothetical protein
MNDQYNIIARPRKQRARRFKPEEVSNEILQQLTLYGVHPVVSYSGAAYIVQLTDPYQQSKVLSWSPLHTSSFVIDLLPWSTELEFGQLPWIPGIPTQLPKMGYVISLYIITLAYTRFCTLLFAGDMGDKSNIIVDALSILPITSKHITSLGIISRLHLY